MMEELLPVAAMGAGAVTKLIGGEGSKIDRLINPKYPVDYCSAIEDIIEKKKLLATLLCGNEDQQLFWRIKP